MSKLRQLLVRANLASLREAEAYCARGWVWHDPDGHVPLGARIARDEESGGVIVGVPDGDGVIGLDKRAVHDQHSRLGGVVLHKPYSFLSHHAAGSRSRDAKTILTANNASSNRAAGGGRAGGGQGHTTWPSVCAWAGVDPANTPDLHVTGRLDADSTGLLVFTRSGLLGRHLVASGERGLSDEVLDHGVGGEGGGAPFEKEYLVRVTVKNGHDRPPPRQRDLDAIVASLGGGVLELDGQRVQPAVVRWLHPGVLQFVMSEGRHRQIRRMCELVGLEVVGLKRVRVGGLRLGKLPVGAWRPFYVNELIPNRADRNMLVPLLSLDTHTQDTPARPVTRPPRGREPQGRSKRDGVRRKS